MPFVVFYFLHLAPKKFNDPFFHCLFCKWSHIKAFIGIIIGYRGRIYASLIVVLQSSPISYISCQKILTMLISVVYFANCPMQQVLGVYIRYKGCYFCSFNFRCLLRLSIERLLVLCRLFIQATQKFALWTKSIPSLDFANAFFHSKIKHRGKNVTQEVQSK